MEVIANRRNQLIAVSILIPVLFLLLVLPTVRAVGADDRTCADETISAGTFGNVTVASGTGCKLNGETVVEGNLNAKGAVDVIVDGVSINGNVSITEATGQVIMINGATIGGNVEAKSNAVETMLIGSCLEGGIAVNGDVTIVGNTSPDLIVANCSVFGGDLVMMDNIATGAGLGEGVIQMHGSSIGGNAQLKGNRARSITFFPDTGDLAGSVDGNVEFKNNSGVVLQVMFAPVGGNVLVEGNFDSALGLFVGGNEIVGNLTCKNNDPDARAGILHPLDGFIAFPNTVDGKDQCDT